MVRWDAVISRLTLFVLLKRRGPEPILQGQAGLTVAYGFGPGEPPSKLQNPEPVLFADTDHTHRTSRRDSLRLCALHGMH